MPASSTEGVSSTSTSASLASNCSERLRTKCGQWPAPGISSRRFASIWQPLQTPSAKCLFAVEEGLELLARPRVEQDRLGPAGAGAQDVAVAEAAAGREPVEAGEVRTPGDDVGHVHVDAVEAGAMEGRGHLHLAVDALLAQHRKPRAHAGLDVRRRHDRRPARSRAPRAAPGRRRRCGHAPRRRSPGCRAGAASASSSRTRGVAARRGSRR
jgi:hypothetical protein